MRKKEESVGEAERKEKGEGINHDGAYQSEITIGDKLIGPDGSLCLLRRQPMMLMSAP